MTNLIRNLFTRSTSQELDALDNKFATGTFQPYFRVRDYLLYNVPKPQWAQLADT